MERDKRILLHTLVLLSFLALCSCVDKKAEYTYEDIVITRYECWDKWPNSKSVFYCNKSDKKCKIEVVGASNYYSALLCINRETRKVWIVVDDCYIRQQNVDTIHFQGDTCWYDRGRPEELKYISQLFYAKNTERLEEDYECYVLMGLGDYMNYEKKVSEEEFPNSQIEAHY